MRKKKYSKQRCKRNPKRKRDALKCRNRKDFGTERDQDGTIGYTTNTSILISTLIKPNKQT